MALRAPDGSVRVRTRLCWAHQPRAAEVFEVLAARVRDARRRGLRVYVEAAPADVLAMIGYVGLGHCMVIEGSAILDGSVEGSVDGSAAGDGPAQDLG